jgi:heme/copper-type cytochrome/quinol oxidase subunit 2
MFDRLFDRWRSEAQLRLRLIIIASAFILSAALAFCFLCAAALVIAVERYGAVDACLASAAVFLVVAAILAIVRSGLNARRRRRKAAEKAAETTPLSPFADPRTVLVTLQIIQTVGLKRLLPVIALGGAAFAIAAAQDPARRRAASRSAKP